MTIVLSYNAVKQSIPMLKNDRWIIEQAENGMISPFIPAQVRNWEGIPTIVLRLAETNTLLDPC